MQFDHDVTVISFEGYWAYPSPLVDRSPGVDGLEFLDPRDLDLTPALSARLEDWFDRTPSYDAAPEDYSGWSKEKLTLAYDLQHELGADITVLYEGRPVREHRGP